MSRRVGLVIWGVAVALPMLASAARGEAVDYAAAMEWLGSEPGDRSTLAAGAKVGHGDLASLRPFVPPGLIEDLDFPEFEAEIQETARYVPHASFESASLLYGGQTELAEDRSLSNYVSGRPFSDERIEAASPEDAAYMVVWNQVYRWQYNGFATDEEHMVLLRSDGEGGRTEPLLEETFQGGGRIERWTVNSYQRVYLNHLAHRPDEEYSLDVDQAEHLHYMDHIAYSHPFEMRGTAMIIERPLDPHAEDQVNAYLPAERKVRRLSAKERADSFQGSDYTLDDFEGFNGRVLAYDWIYRGRRDILYSADVTAEPLVFFGPGSRVLKGRWQVRPCHVVEQISRTPDHPYGRRLLFIDSETYNIPLALNFDHDDELWRVMVQVYEWPWEGPAPDDAGPGDTVPRWRAGVSTDVRNGNATHFWSNSTVLPELKRFAIKRRFNVSNLSEGR